MRQARRVAGIGSAAVFAAVLAGCNPQVVSINGAGTNSGDRASFRPVVSPDGTKVAFESWASDLDGGGSDDYMNIYVRDLTAGTTELVSTNDAGDPPDLDSIWPVFSPDGTKVVFNSRARNLTPEPGGGGDYALYVRDLVADTTELVSVDASGSVVPGSAPVFSPDGARVAFETGAGGLGPTDGNSSTDVYIRDLGAGTTTLVSRNAAGSDAANLGATGAVFSPDGTRVGYTSSSTDLGPADANHVQDAYVTDLATGTTTLVSHVAGGAASANGPSDMGAFSPDGSVLVFRSWATDLVPGTPVDDFADLFVRDLATGATTRVAANANPAFDNGSFPTPVFSPDGSRFAFVTNGSGLGATDTVVCRDRNIPPRQFPCQDVYLHDLGTGTTTLVSGNAAGTNGGNGESFDPDFSPDGSRLVFTSAASDLGPTDTNGQWDVYVADLATGDVTMASTKAGGADSASGRSYEPQFGKDERTVVFGSSAEDMGPGPDTNGTEDVYLKVLPG